MHFDGLIRKFTKLPTLKDNEHFIRLNELLDPLVTMNNPLYTRPDTAMFEDCAVFRLMCPHPALERVPPEPPISAEMKAAVDGIVAELNKLFLTEQKIFNSQVFWLYPGSAVRTHCDTKRPFIYAKRFNIVMRAGPATYYLHKGDGLRIPFKIEDGDVIELNNRSTHSVLNTSQNPMVLLVFDFVDVGQKPFTLVDIKTDDWSGTCLTKDSPVVIYDY